MSGGDNAAAIMNLPFSAQAIEAGMKSLGRVNDTLGPYQAGGAFVLCSWAKSACRDAAERSRRLHRKRCAGWSTRADRAEAIALLMNKRNLSQSLDDRSYDLMIEPGFGFNPDAKLSAEGFENVLKLRQEVEGGPAPNPAKYLDLGCTTKPFGSLRARGGGGDEGALKAVFAACVLAAGLSTAGAVRTVRGRRHRLRPERLLHRHAELALARRPGNPAAQSNIALMYAKGQGVSKDYVQAHMWASLSASKENPGRRRSIAIASPRA